MKYVIKREDKPGEILQYIIYGNKKPTEPHVYFSTCEFYAYKTENIDDAQYLIKFIKDQINYELGKQLVIVPLEN